MIGSYKGRTEWRLETYSHIENDRISYWDVLMYEQIRSERIIDGEPLPIPVSPVEFKLRRQ